VPLDDEAQARANPPGSELRVRIVAADEHDLVAEEVGGKPGTDHD